MGSLKAYGVEASAAEYRIGPQPAIDEVIAVAALNPVIAVPRKDDIVAAKPEDPIFTNSSKKPPEGTT